jgi:hypothetical protein
MADSTVMLSELEVVEILDRFIADVSARNDYSIRSSFLPIPLEIEQDPSSIWPSIEQFSGEQLSYLRNHITWKICLKLLTYGYRMISYAIREKNPKWILYTLYATVIDNDEADMRDTLSVFSLCYDAANVLGISPVDLFYRAAKLATLSRAELTREYVDDPEFPKTILEMGFARIEMPNGPCYVKSL